MMASPETIIPWICATIIAPILLLFLSKFLWKIYWDSTKDENSKLPLPPGNYGWPFIGNTLEFIRLNKKSDYYKESRRKYGPVYKTHLFGKPMVRVNGEKLVGSLLVQDHSNFKENKMKTVRTLFGTHALTNTPAEIHKDKRKVVKTAFSPESLEEYTEHLRIIIEKEIKRLSKLPLVETFKEMETLAFRAACEILIGLPVELINSKQFVSDFHDFVTGFFSLPVNLPGTTYNKAIKARENMSKALRPLIQDLITGGVDGRDKIRTSGLEYIMSAHRDNEDTVTESELLDRILELLFAGHKTVASAATSLVMFLGQNPHVADKIEKELEVNDIQNLSNDFTYKNLSTLTYLGDVVKEVLRLAPPVGGIIRQTHDTLEVGGYQVPKGWLVICSVLDTHKMDETWAAEDRENFKPERWTTLEKPYRTRYGHIPFGVGPRICVGRTYADIFLRVLAITLVWECDIELKNPTPRMRRLPVLYPEDNLPAVFVRKP